MNATFIKYAAFFIKLRRAFYLNNLFLRKSVYSSYIIKSAYMTQCGTIRCYKSKTIAEILSDGYSNWQECGSN